MRFPFWSRALVASAGHKRNVTAACHAIGTRMIWSCGVWPYRRLYRCFEKSYLKRAEQSGGRNDHLTGELVGSDAGKLRFGAQDPVAANPNRSRHIGSAVLRSESVDLIEMKRQQEAMVIRRNEITSDSPTIARAVTASKGLTHKGLTKPDGRR
jgi:hypothetical protein